MNNTADQGDARAIELAMLRAYYGPKAVIEVSGKFTFVHKYNPTPEVINERKRSFNTRYFFSPHCPYCRDAKQFGAFIIYGDGEPYALKKSDHLATIKDAIEEARKLVGEIPQ